MPEHHYDLDEETTDSEVSSVGHADESEEYSQSSQESTDSNEDSNNVWTRLQEEAINRHQEQWKALVMQYEGDGDAHEVAVTKASNALVPTYRKELREVLLEQLKWVHYLKKDPIYHQVMETKQNLIDSENFGWLEATESAIHKRKFLLNKLFEKEKVSEQKTAVHDNPFNRYSSKSNLL